MGKRSLTLPQEKKNNRLTFEFRFNVMLPLIFYFWICFNPIAFSSYVPLYQTSLKPKTLPFFKVGVLLILVKSLDRFKSNDYLNFFNFFNFWLELQCKWAFLSTVLNCGVPLDIKDRCFYCFPSIGCQTPFYLPL
jgi:hypothetical protein